MTTSIITRITFSSAQQRKVPKAGDERFLKGRGVTQIRQQQRVGPGMPHAGTLLVSNGRPVWEWVDKGSDRDRTSEAWRAKRQAEQ